MNGDEEMLYMIIKDTLREGIWSKQLKTKTNMHQTTLNKSLKSLEQKRYVKVIQSVKVRLLPPPDPPPNPKTNTMPPLSTSTPRAKYTCSMNSLPLLKSPAVPGLPMANLTKNS